MLNLMFTCIKDTVELMVMCTPLKLPLWFRIIKYPMQEQSMRKITNLSAHLVEYLEEGAISFHEVK